MTRNEVEDWMTGAPAILYQSCSACRAIWYFRRGFCPSCGATDPQTLHATGHGIVYATTIVCRAATPETKAYVPFAIMLIDAAEGFRMMAHGDKNLAIGDVVVARFERFTDRLMPYFDKA